MDNDAVRYDMVKSEVRGSGIFDLKGGAGVAGGYASDVHDHFSRLMMLASEHEKAEERYEGEADNEECGGGEVEANKDHDSIPSTYCRHPSAMSRKLRCLALPQAKQSHACESSPALRHPAVNHGDPISDLHANHPSSSSLLERAGSGAPGPSPSCVGSNTRSSPAKGLRLCNVPKTPPDLLVLMVDCSRRDQPMLFMLSRKEDEAMMAQLWEYRVGLLGFL
nr:hypothetical protein CFP56_00779 [Quercus suber]